MVYQIGLQDAVRVAQQWLSTLERLSCSAHGAGCHSCPRVVLKVWRIPEELLQGTSES